jgi:hypothetical protein
MTRKRKDRAYASFKRWKLRKKNGRIEKAVDSQKRSDVENM